MGDYKDDMIVDFINESKELLDSIQDDFLVLERQGNPDKNLINNIFRAIHTIKGTSGFLALEKISRLSHIIETILARLRDGQLNMDSIIADSIFEGIDNLKNLINNIGQINNIDIQIIISKLNDLIDNNLLNENTKDDGTKTIPRDEIDYEVIKNISTIDTFDKELINGFLSEITKVLASLEENFNDFDLKYKNQGEKFIVNFLRELDIIKGTSGMVGLNQISLLSEYLANIIIAVKDAKIDISDETMSIFFAGFDKLQALVDDIYLSNKTDISTILELIQSYIDSNQKFVDDPNQNVLIGNENQMPIYVTEIQSYIPDNKKVDSLLRNDKNIENKPGLYDNIEKIETVRLDVKVIDKLMRLAGELVLVRNQQLTTIEQSIPIRRDVIQRLDNVTTELQETIMQTRLQPIGNLFNKFSRLIRDVCRQLDKDIELIIKGGDVELDKTIIEALTAPMTHLIRNAADHGIEPKDERMESGKQTPGQIILRAYHEGGLVTFEIEDDGRGINLDHIRNKAFESGLRTKPELARMNNNELLNLIMLPGFTTAGELTNISGRGIGMDVVKSIIEKLSGSIEIHSQKNIGTVISMKLPLTLAIIPSLIVASGENRYAIPQVNLEELINIKDQEVKTKIENVGYQEVYRLRNRLLPLVRLNEILKNPNKFNTNVKFEIIKRNQNETTLTSLNFAVLIVGNRRFGLIFDNIVGSEEIVVQPMHPAVNFIKIFSGATILGDGSVALILDVDGILNHADIDFNLRMKKAELPVHEKNIAKSDSLLLFKSGPVEQFAISVSLIRRIEQFDKSHIERVGLKEFVAIKNQSYRIVRIEEIMKVSPCIDRDEMYLIILKLVTRPIGILFSYIIDTQNIKVNINTEVFNFDGLLGTAVIESEMTLFLDVYRILELAEPEWFDKNFTNEICKQEYVPLAEKIKVLLVDDSSIFRQMIDKYLNEEGYEVTITGDSIAAIQLIENQKFDLLISDLDLSFADGFELIKAVRNSALQPDIPAIALTALKSDLAGEKAILNGYNRVEVKIDKFSFFRTISELLFVSNQTGKNSINQFISQ